MKAIKLEDINALQRYAPCQDAKTYVYELCDCEHGKAVLLDDLRALYDNAPSVGGEPFLYLRLKNGQPDWDDDCVSTHYSDLTENGKIDDGIYSALPLYTTPQSDRVPEGYALVPIKPTKEMIEKGGLTSTIVYDDVEVCIDDETAESCYKAMITEAMKNKLSNSQPDRVAELEAKLEESRKALSIIANKSHYAMNPTVMSGVIEFKRKVAKEALVEIDQAMKG